MLCASPLCRARVNTLWTERAVRITPAIHTLVDPLTKVPSDAHKHVGLSLTLHHLSTLARSPHTPVSTVDSVITSLCITA